MQFDERSSLTVTRACCPIEESRWRNHAKRTTRVVLRRFGIRSWNNELFQEISAMRAARIGTTGSP
jgi:hypothetical protein